MVQKKIARRHDLASMEKKLQWDLANVRRMAIVSGPRQRVRTGARNAAVMMTAFLLLEHALGAVQKLLPARTSPMRTSVGRRAALQTSPCHHPICTRRVRNG